MRSESDLPAISVEDLQITYSASFESRHTNRRFLPKGLRAKRARPVSAVRGISFDVPRGSVLGMIGKNGSGKSTTLRAIAGVLPASTGKITVRGRVAPLLSLGVGFNATLSGRDNIKLGGLVAGFTPAEMKGRVDEIIEFAGLGDAINRAVRTYSNGMRARLAFSVASYLEPDVLLLDEVLAPGDAEFKVRASEKIKDLISSDATVVLVSHALGEIQALSDHVIWLRDGTIEMEGEPSEVVERFQEAYGANREAQVDMIEVWMMKKLGLDADAMRDAGADARKAILEADEETKRAVFEAALAEAKSPMGSGN